MVSFIRRVHFFSSQFTLHNTTRMVMVAEVIKGVFVSPLLNLASKGSPTSRFHDEAASIFLPVFDPDCLALDLPERLELSCVPAPGGNGGELLLSGLA